METLAIILVGCFGLFLLIAFFGSIGSMIRMEFRRRDSKQTSLQKKNADEAAF